MVNYASKDIPLNTILGLRMQVKRRPDANLEQSIRQRPEYRFIDPNQARVD